MDVNIQKWPECQQLQLHVHEVKCVDLLYVKIDVHVQSQWKYLKYINILKNDETR